MPARPRPLSPHLQIYRWQIGNSLSILHRATGAALALALPALAYWLLALAGGAGSYRSACRAFASGPGMLLLVLLSFAFFYHLCNGVRHLFWDAGWGFERRARHVSGWTAVLGALLATAALWVLIRHGGRA